MTTHQYYLVTTTFKYQKTLYAIADFRRTLMGKYVPCVGAAVQAFYQPRLEKNNIPGTKTKSVRKPHFLSEATFIQAVQTAYYGYDIATNCTLTPIEGGLRVFRHRNPELFI